MSVRLTDAQTCDSSQIYRPQRAPHELNVPALPPPGGGELNIRCNPGRLGHIGARVTPAVRVATPVGALLLLPPPPLLPLPVAVRVLVVAFGTAFEHGLHLQRGPVDSQGAVVSPLPLHVAPAADDDALVLDLRTARHRHLALPHVALRPGELQPLGRIPPSQLVNAADNRELVPEIELPLDLEPHCRARLGSDGHGPQPDGSSGDPPAPRRAREREAHAPTRQHVHTSRRESECRCVPYERRRARSSGTSTP